MEENNSANDSAKMKRTKVPPLGAKPKFIHDEYRIVELKAAIDRFMRANWPIPIEFCEEYNELVSALPEEEL